MSIIAKLSWKSHQKKNDFDSIYKYELQRRTTKILEWQLYSFILPTSDIFFPMMERFTTSILGEYRIRSFDILGNPSDWFPVIVEQQPSYIVRGSEVFDPRDNSWKISDNPALVMADLADRGVIKTPWRLDKALDNPFWDWIGELADVCDQKIEV